MGLSLALIYAEAGRFNKALGLFEEARKYTSDIEEISRMERNRAYLLLRVGEAREVLDAAKDLSKYTDSRYALNEAVELRAMALATLDSLEAAKSASAELESLEDSWGRHAVLMASKVNAEIALTEGNPQEALASLHEMGAAPLCGLGLFSIEYWEALASAHRMAGRLNEALKAHQEILQLHGGHALSHYVLGQIYEEMDRPADAAHEFTKFLEMWSNADEGLPQVEDAKKRLAALQQTIQ
jgi:tetratricopeptide (TPR) repeat protein